MPRHSSGKALGELSKFPVATLGIILLNVAAAIITRWDMYYYVEVYVKAYGLIPSMFRPGSLLTSAFVHDGWIHLSLNMVMLYVFGGPVERAMGKLEYVMFYLGACFVSSLAHVAIVFATMPPFYETRAVVGASGAVAGVAGIYAVRFHRKSFRFAGTEFPALLLLLCWLILQLGLGILGIYRDELLGLGLKQVGYWSHLGGFAFGVGVALLANMAVAGEREYLSGRGRFCYEQGNYLEAVRSHETLLDYDPQNADSFAEMGRLWALLDEEQESLRCYQVAVQLYTSQGKERRALEAAEEMRSFWPTSGLDSATRFRLASYLDEAGEPERAIQAFRQIATEDPGSAEAQMSLLKIGQCQLSSMSDPASAAVTLEDFLTRYPDSEWRAFAQDTMARAAEEARRFDSPQDGSPRP